MISGILIRHRLRFAKTQLHYLSGRQLMATDGNWRQHNGSSVQKQYRWEINYAGLHQPSQCQVHSKSADTINTVRLTWTGLDTKLSYTIYDDRITPLLLTHWQMCKATVPVTHQCCRYPGVTQVKTSRSRRHSGTGPQSSVRPLC